MPHISRCYGCGVNRQLQLGFDLSLGTSICHGSVPKETNNKKKFTKIKLPLKFVSRKWDSVLCCYATTSLLCWGGESQPWWLRGLIRKVPSVNFTCPNTFLQENSYQFLLMYRLSTVFLPEAEDRVGEAMLI